MLEASSDPVNYINRIKRLSSSVQLQSYLDSASKVYCDLIPSLPKRRKQERVLAIKHRGMQLRLTFLVGEINRGFL